MAKKSTRVELEHGYNVESSRANRMDRFLYCKARGETTVIRGTHAKYEGHYLFEAAPSPHWNHCVLVTWFDGVSVQSASVFSVDQLSEQHQQCLDFTSPQHRAWCDGWARTKAFLAGVEEAQYQSEVASRVGQ